jgi:hypothetical protein
MFGFKDSDDYYNTASSEQHISAINVPTLIVNAINDPFLSKSCFPIESCKYHKFVTLEMPENGGHVGFVSKGNVYWSEKRALEFIQSI